MKQMINNHRTIESLEDFIYYDKTSGKIIFKKPTNVGGLGHKLTISVDIGEEYEALPVIGLIYADGSFDDYQVSEDDTTLVFENVVAFGEVDDKVGYWDAPNKPLLVCKDVYYNAYDWQFVYMLVADTSIEVHVGE